MIGAHFRTGLVELAVMQKKVASLWKYMGVSVLSPELEIVVGFCATCASAVIHKNKKNGLIIFDGCKQGHDPEWIEEGHQCPLWLPGIHYCQKHKIWAQKDSPCPICEEEACDVSLDDPKCDRFTIDLSEVNGDGKLSKKTRQDVLK